MTRSGTVEAADVASARPAPGCRSVADVEAVWEAIGELCEALDLRTHALISGVMEALGWVEGETDRDPFGRECPSPNLAEIELVVAVAGRLADTGVGLAGPVPDGARIYARGVEECLTWWAVPSCPWPVWARPGVAELVVIANVLGGVGRGVDIDEASNGQPFPYRLAGIIRG